MPCHMLELELACTLLLELLAPLSELWVPTALEKALALVSLFVLQPKLVLDVSVGVELLWLPCILGV